MVASNFSMLRSWNNVVLASLAQTARYILFFGPIIHNEAGADGAERGDLQIRL